MHLYLIMQLNSFWRISITSSKDVILLVLFGVVYFKCSSSMLKVVEKQSSNFSFNFA